MEDILLPATSLLRFQDAGSEPVQSSQLYDDETITRMPRGSFDDWFSRPVVITSFSLYESTAFTPIAFSPWALYFQHNLIQPKLKGFARLRSKLHLKFTINGSPFRYGDYLVSYKPLSSVVGLSSASSMAPNFSGGHISEDTAFCATDAAAYVYAPTGKVPGVATTSDISRLARSQRPNIHLYPQTSTGGEMVLPFIYYQDAILLSSSTADVGLSNTLSEMGTIIVESVVNLLTTASANTNPVSVQVFAWAEDIEVFMPTGLSQGGSEFSDVVSKPSGIASAVANAAGALVKVPVIGAFAQATQMAAMGVSSILRLFGWSNPPVITAVSAMLPWGGFINPSPLTSIQDFPLALDPKNELSVDPRIVGCPPADELVISHFCAREAMLPFIQWQVSDAPGYILGSFPCVPNYYLSEWITNTTPTTGSSLDCSRTVMTPATYAAQLFSFWRGDFVLRLRVICSAFHRGRLRIRWDPMFEGGAMLATSEGYQISDIIDISNATDITVKIPFSGVRGFLSVDHRAIALNVAGSGTTDFRAWRGRGGGSGYNNEYCNKTCAGIVEVSVMNELQCGNVTAAAYLIPYVSFENMKFMGPYDSNFGNDGTTSTPFLGKVAFGNFVSQASSFEPDGSATVDASIHGDTDQLSLIYGGESVPSLRCLLHRTYVHRSFVGRLHESGVSNAYGYTLRNTIWGRIPSTFGNPSGSISDASINGDHRAGGTGVFLYSPGLTNPITYLAACFVGQRGSFVWRVSDSSVGSNGAIVVHNFLSRSGHQAGVSDKTVGYSNTAALRGVADLVVAKGLGNLASGATSADYSIGQVCRATLPMYSNLRLFPGNPTRLYDAQTIAKVMPEYDNVCYTQIASGNAANLSASTAAPVSNAITSVAAGSDFSLYFFLNTPEIFQAPF